MNKRILFYLFALLLFAGLSFWIYKLFVSPTNNDLRINVISLNGKVDLTTISEYSAQKLDDNIEKATIIFGEKKKMIEKQTGIADENSFKEQFTRSIKEIVKSSPSEKSPEQINSILSNFAKSLVNSDKDVYNCIVLTGVFPENYNKIEADKCIKNLKEEFGKIDPETKIEIIINFETNQEEVERIIIKEIEKLSGTNIKVINKSKIVPKRVFKDNSSKNVYAVFFSPLKNTEINEFGQFLLSKFGEKINLKIWSDDSNNDKLLNLNSKNLYNETLNSLLPNITKANWTALGFLIKQASNKMNQLSEKENKELVLIGNFPNEGKGSQLDEKTWKTLQAIRNLSIYFYLPTKCKKNKTDLEFREGLNSFKILYQDN